MLAPREPWPEDWHDDMQRGLAVIARAASDSLSRFTTGLTRALRQASLPPRRDTVNVPETGPADCRCRERGCRDSRRRGTAVQNTRRSRSARSRLLINSRAQRLGCGAADRGARHGPGWKHDGPRLRASGSTTRGVGADQRRRTCSCRSSRPSPGGSGNRARPQPSESPSAARAARSRSEKTAPTAAAAADLPSPTV